MVSVWTTHCNAPPLFYFKLFSVYWLLGLWLVVNAGLDCIWDAHIPVSKHKIGFIFVYVTSGCVCIDWHRVLRISHRGCMG